MPPQKRYIPNTLRREKKGVAAPCKALLLDKYTWILCALFNLTPPRKKGGSFLWKYKKKLHVGSLRNTVAMYQTKSCAMC